VSSGAMEHPDPATLTALGAGLLEAGEAQTVRAHLSGCGDCARRVSDAEADFDRIGRALAAPAPAELESRVLRILAPRRWGRVAAAAAALVLCALLGGLYSRVRALEDRLARVVPPPPPAASDDSKELAEILSRVSTDPIEQALVRGTELSDRESRFVHEAVARATDDGMRRLGRYLAGEVPAGELVGRDLLAGLDLDSLPDVAREIDRRQTEAVVALANSVADEVCRRVGASEAQSDRIRLGILRAAGTRRDIAFFPPDMVDVIKRMELRCERGWRGTIAEELTPEQRVKFDEYAQSLAIRRNG